MAEYELGVFFDLKETSPRNYIAESLEIFFSHCEPGMLKSADLFCGEIKGHVPGASPLFCIAVRTSDISTIQYLKNVFGESDERRLAPPIDRIRESNVVSEGRLKRRGRIDAEGRFETEAWNRVDYDVCRVTGWPYTPQSYPKHIPPKTLDELEKMAGPGLRTPKSPSSVSGKKAQVEPPQGESPKIDIGGIAKRFVLLCIVAGLFVLGVLGWLNRDQYLEAYRAKRQEMEMTHTLGEEGYARYKEGFMVVDVANTASGFPIEELSRRLGEKGYLVLDCEDKSLIDASLEASSWFAENRAGANTTIQAFANVTIRERGGPPAWYSLAKGTATFPDSEPDPLVHRRNALSEAIANIDLSELPDGKELKRHRGFDGFAQVKAQEIAESRREKAEQKLRREIQRHVSSQWIMSHRLHLKSGGTMDVVILKQQNPKLWVRTGTGRLMMPERRIEKVEPFGVDQYSLQIGESIALLKKSLDEDWEHTVCNQVVAELSERFSVYGPAFPEAHVLDVGVDEVTGASHAILETKKGNHVKVVNGRPFQGFTVIGIDPETRSVLVRMGEGGEILRIWPRPETG